MPNHRSAWKRLRQNERRRMTNKSHLSFVRKSIKAFKALDDSEVTRENFSSVTSDIDKSVNKGIMHHRKAARLKSRLSRKVTGS